MKRTFKVLCVVLLITCVCLQGDYVVKSSAKSVKPQKITIKADDIENNTLYVGQEVAMQAVVKPKGASQSVKWSSSNKKIASFDSEYLTGKSEGTVTITATSKKNKKIKGTCKLKVKKADVEGIELNYSTYILNTTAGRDTVELSVGEWIPYYSYDSDIKWSSSDESVAIVDEKGKVTAKKIGETMITATTSNGKTATCEIIVEKDYNPPEDYKAKKDNVIYGTYETVQYDSATVGKKRNVTVVIPPNYTTDKKYPVVYLLHGLGQDNTQWIVEGKVQIVLGNMIAEGTAKEMILVLPNCRARQNDAANPSDCWTLPHYQSFDNFKNDLENDLMPFINSNYSVAEGRENTAIAGFSMGGRTALYIGMSMQDTFGYVAGFCPAPGIFGYNMNGVTEEGLFTKENFKIEDKYVGKTVVMIVAGRSDTIVYDWPETYHNGLDANGSENIFYKVKGGHDFITTCNGFYNFAKMLFN